MSSEMSDSRGSSLSHKAMQRIYKGALHLFLTRRLANAWAVIRELILPSKRLDTEDVIIGDEKESPSETATDDLPSSWAPIALASDKLRVRVWSLYLAIWSAAMDLGPEEGQAQLGQEEWKALASQVRSGSVWDFVTIVGYQGKQEALDAAVVSNMTTLLLNHSPSQAISQQRLELYLSSSNQAWSNDKALLGSPDTAQGVTPDSDATSCPQIPIPIFELFVLHVLPRNEEYLFAEEFIRSSDAISEDQKQYYVSTLRMLKEERERGILRATEIQRRRDQEMEQQHQVEEEVSQKTLATETHSRQAEPVSHPLSKDANRTVKTVNMRNSSSNFEASTAPTERGETRRLMRLLRFFSSSFRSLRHIVEADPVIFVHVLLVIFGFLMAIRHTKFRRKLLAGLNIAFKKVRETVGMGARISQI